MLIGQGQPGHPPSRVARGPGRQPPDLKTTGPEDEVAIAKHAALVSWIMVGISLLVLFLVSGTVP
jgi:hypothetical protein